MATATPFQVIGENSLNNLLTYIDLHGLGCNTVKTKTITILGDKCHDRSKIQTLTVSDGSGKSAKRTSSIES